MSGEITTRIGGGRKGDWMRRRNRVRHNKDCVISIRNKQAFIDCKLSYIFGNKHEFMNVRAVLDLRDDNFDTLSGETCTALFSVYIQKKEHIKTAPCPAVTL